LINRKREKREKRKNKKEKKDENCASFGHSYSIAIVS
jgi:hypothetical protein